MALLPRPRPRPCPVRCSRTRPLLRPPIRITPSVGTAPTRDDRPNEHTFRLWGPLPEDPWVHPTLAWRSTGGASLTVISGQVSRVPRPLNQGGGGAGASDQLRQGSRPPRWSWMTRYHRPGSRFQGTVSLGEASASDRPRACRTGRRATSCTAFAAATRAILAVSGVENLISRPRGRRVRRNRPESMARLQLFPRRCWIAARFLSPHPACFDQVCR